MYPIVPLSMRIVMNACVVEGHELPAGSRVFLAQTASHYMDEVCPAPFTFDIDRYAAPRNEHLSPGYAPNGLGRHRCLGFRWMELRMMINLLMVAHYFILEVSPANYRNRMSPFPSLKPIKKLHFKVAKQVREVPV